MFKMIDLFAGMGGIRIAFENNGVTCVASSEIDKYARETYYKNFGEYPLGDITKINTNDLPHFDILAGGFPCQPFSLAGLRKGFEDTRGTLFFEVVRLINDCQPLSFFLENVEGIVNHDNGNTIKVIENTLDNLGYNFKWAVMNASDYGVPQNRKRWYCVGFKNETKIGFEEQDGDFIAYYKFPSKCTLHFTVNDIIDENVSDEYNSTDTCNKNITLHLDKFIKGPRYNENHVLIANEIRPSRCNFRCDGISPCLTAKMGTGGNNIPVLVKEKRKLTERECLRLMGFPDWYKIDKNCMHSYKQIGNSVIVPVIDKLAKEMVRVLNEYKTTK